MENREEEGNTKSDERKYRFQGAVPLRKQLPLSHTRPSTRKK